MLVSCSHAYGISHVLEDDDRVLVILVPFNSIPTISGAWVGDNGRLCAMELHLRLKRSSTQAGLNLGPLDQQASAEPTELSGLLFSQEN